MNITQQQVVKPSEVPDAIQIDIAGVTFLVNRHTGVVTVEGAQHVKPTEGENNTLRIHACPNIASGLDKILNGSLLGKIGEEFLPGFRLGTMDDLINMMGTGRENAPKDPFDR